MPGSRAEAILLRRDRSDRSRHAVPKKTGEALARAFFEARRHGDPTVPSRILAREVRIYSDGGGKVVAFLSVTPWPNASPGSMPGRRATPALRPSY